MSYTFNQKVLFKHCDLAGIVFYPRYFEMLNDCVEAFFDTVLAFSFEAIHLVGGIPTVQISATFTAPSRHGDRLEIELSCIRLGRTSLDLRFVVQCEQQTRIEAKSTIVFVDKSGKPESWPPVLRQAIERQLDEKATDQPQLA